MERSTITSLLLRIRDGDADAYEALLPLVYDELRRLAARSLRDERANHTLQPTALVHEAYLRLVDQHSPGFESRRQFYGVAAQIMRRVLVDSARRHRSAKRGAGQVVSLDEQFADAVAVALPADDDVLEVDAALQELQQLDARQSRIVELRYFVGLSVEETAQVLQISERTVKRDWAVARAFLHRALRRERDR